MVLCEAVPSLLRFRFDYPGDSARFVRPTNHPCQPGRHLRFKSQCLGMNVGSFGDDSLKVLAIRSKRPEHEFPVLIHTERACSS